MKAKHITKQFLLGAGIFLFGLVVLQASVSASILDVDATGSITFDDSYSYGNVSGSFSAIEGGGSTTSTYSGSSVTLGSNPLSANFSALNDGFALSGTASATDDLFGAAIDFNLDLKNNHATEAYEVKIRINLIRNAVNADGPDAFAQSEFTVDDSTGEIFFSDLLSDTAFGDEAGGTLSGPYGPTGTFGDPQSESGFIDFTYVLNAGDMQSLSGTWLLDDSSGDYDGTGLAEADFEAKISIIDVSRVSGPGPNPNPVPEPGTLILFGAGLLGLARYSRYQKKHR